MQARFHKMHGLGNDFVVIDARETAVAMTPARAAAIANRHTGIGCDQLILIEPSEAADAKMRIFNADGSEVEACGNAARCVAVLLGGKATIETLGGPFKTEPGDNAATVRINHPNFDWDAIPLSMPMDTYNLPVGWEDLNAPMAVNVGNPHVVFFVDDCDAVDLERLGPIIENDPLFPERVNVNVASVIDAERVLYLHGSVNAFVTSTIGKNHLKLRVWERGVGLTQACGTGACATAVAAIRSKRVSAPVTVSLPGGDLVIDWTLSGGIEMTGPATHVFTGEADWSQFG